MGRKQGRRRGWRYATHGLERGRLQERAALDANARLEIVDDPRSADLVQIRLNPEQTSARVLAHVRRIVAALPPNVRVLNHPRHFPQSAEKHLTYEAWRDAGLATPDFATWSLALPARRQIRQVRALLDGRAGYLRTHNEDSGKGIFHLAGGESDEALARIIWKLRLRKLMNRTSGSRALVTAEVPNRRHGVAEVFRVHLVGGRPFCGYGIVGRSDVIHAGDVPLDCTPQLLDANRRLHTWLQDADWLATLDRALRALGLDFAAVEFFDIGGEPVFLEANPMWGGKHRIGGPDVMAWIRDGIPDADRERLPMLYRWIDPRAFYDGYWDSIADLLDARPSDDAKQA